MKNRMAVVRYAVAGLVMLFGTVVMAAWPANPDAWVRANPDRVPRSLQEFSRIPLFAHRAAFRAMTLENKSRIWKERLSSLSRDDRFSTAQREVLVRFAESLVPQAYVPGSAENAEAKTLCEAAKDWPEELKAELRQLVATSSLQKTVASVSEGLGRQIASLFQLNADFPYCNCDRDSWCSGDCQIALCRGTDWGCGCGFIWACDGCDSGCGW